MHLCCRSWEGKDTLGKHPGLLLSWKWGGFPLIPWGVKRKERWGKEQNLKNT